MSQGHRGHPHGQYNINFKTNLSEVEKAQYGSFNISQYPGSLGRPKI